MATVSTEQFVRSTLTLVKCLYGDDRQHLMLRSFVADYLKAELPFFKQFMVDQYGPDHYIRQLKSDGVWADDLEIQIISELYDCRIEIFSTSNTPMKTFNEQPEAIKVPLRLFYVQQCHYDIIWDLKRPHPLQNHTFGLLERASLEAAQERDSNKNSHVNNKPQQSVLSSSSPSRESRSFFEKNSKNI